MLTKASGCGLARDMNSWLDRSCAEAPVWIIIIIHDSSLEQSVCTHMTSLRGEHIAAVHPRVLSVSACNIISALRPSNRSSTNITYLL
jgi:hypothetical protein